MLSFALIIGILSFSTAVEVTTKNEVKFDFCHHGNPQPIDIEQVQTRFTQIDSAVFRCVHINVLKTDTFRSLTVFGDIIFEDSIINVIENRAFSFVRFLNRGSLIFKNIRGIRHVGNEAFLEIRDGKIQINDCEIQGSLPYGTFTNNREVDITIENSNIGMLGPSAFLNPTNFLNVVIESNTIGMVHDNAFDVGGSDVEHSFRLRRNTITVINPSEVRKSAEDVSVSRNNVHVHNLMWLQYILIVLGGALLGAIVTGLVMTKCKGYRKMPANNTSDKTTGNSSQPDKEVVFYTNNTYESLHSKPQVYTQKL